MTHVSKKEIAASSEGGSERRLTCGDRGVEALVDDDAVDMLIEALGPRDELLRDRIVDPQAPFPKVPDQIHERRKSEMASRFACAGATEAEAVGDDHPVAELLEFRGNASLWQARQERVVLSDPLNDDIVILVDAM